MKYYRCKTRKVLVRIKPTLLYLRYRQAYAGDNIQINSGLGFLGTVDRILFELGEGYSVLSKHDSTANGVVQPHLKFIEEVSQI